MYELLYTKPTKHMILGPGCSEVLEVAAQVTPAWNITHVSTALRLNKAETSIGENYQESDNLKVTAYQWKELFKYCSNTGTTFRRKYHPAECNNYEG